MSYEVEIEDDGLEDPIAQSRADAAEALAVLSQASDTPLEFEQTSAPFDPSAVDFDTDSWIARVADVQGWLRLDEPLPLASTRDFVYALARMLEFREPGDAVFPDNESPQLNSVGLDRLRDRAERAARLQRSFLDEFEGDGGTRVAATRSWAAAWEDEDEDPAEVAVPEPVSAKASTWRINEFVEAAKAGRLNLAPSYQRGDVWGTGARQVLIESILRGIPLPSVILLRPSGGTAQPYEVVDGKQRLTSILRFVGKHPVAMQRVAEAEREKPGNDLGELFATDYPKFKRAWKNLFGEPITTSVEEQYFFPFRLRTDDRGLAGEELAPLRGKYYTQVKTHQIKVADDPVMIGDVFEGFSEYSVPIIVYNRATQRQIHEVFNLYNKQGTHLNAEEIRNAIFHELELTRAILVAAGDSDRRTVVAEIAPSLVNDWGEVSLLQQTLSGYGFGEARYRRTKVLSWIVATLLSEAPGENLPSTARHIDNLLQRVQGDPKDRLRQPTVLTHLVRWIADAVDLHASHSELWAPAFKDGGAGAKWQELQLVGSIVGVAIAATVRPDELDDLLYAHQEEIYRASRSEAWHRPEKTQTRTQWEYIARVAKAITDILEVDAHQAADVLRSRFGSSNVDALLAMAGDGAHK